MKREERIIRMKKGGIIGIENKKWRRRKKRNREKWKRRKEEIRERKKERRKKKVRINWREEKF